jgi:hypothetical protein
MAIKSDFTPGEWKQLLESVMMAGIAVTAADPSGLWGTLKETFSSAQSMIAGKTGSNELIKAVVADFETSEGRTTAREGLSAQLKGNKSAEISAKAVDSLRQAAALMDTKAPADAPAFKAWLLSISKSVADASSEGGFLGFGGVTVSDAEKATLADIQSALKL